MQHSPSAEPAAQRPMPASWLYGLFGAFVLVLLGLAALLYQQALHAVESNARQSLLSTTSLSLHALEAWMGERAADADVIAGNPLLAQALARRAGDPPSGRPADLAAVQAHLDAVRVRYGYRSVTIADSSGAALAASGERPSAPELQQLFTRTAQPHSASSASSSSSTWPSWVKLPARSDGLLRGGVVRRLPSGTAPGGLLLLLEPDPAQLAAALQQARPGEWPGETLLIDHDGASASYLAPSGPAVLHPITRLRAGGPLPVEHPGASADLTLAKGLNRLGTPVFAMRTTADLPQLQIVSMLDQAAAYAPLHRQVRVAAPLGLLLVLLMLVTLVVWRRSQGLREALRARATRQYYEDILFDAADSFVLNDVEGHLLQVSDSAARLFGYTREQMLRLNARDLMTPAQLGQALRHASGMVQGERRTFQLERLRADGSVFLQEGQVGLDIIDGKRYYHTTGRDVTQKHAVDTRLRIAASFFERTAAAVLICDPDKRILMVNPSFETVTGYGPDEAVGMQTSVLNAGQDSAQTQRMQQALAEHGHWEGELAGRRKNGDIYPRSLTVSVYRDAQGRIEQYISIFTDLSLLRTAQSQAEYFAHHDPLTRLPNRTALDRLLPGLLERARELGRSVTVALLNVDRFKHINETLGHAQGDVLLLTLARRLRTLFPDADQVFRYGGDEFMLVLEGEPVLHALQLGKVRAAVSPAVVLDGHPVSPSASFGVAIYPEHADNAGALLRNVAAALGVAKGQGRNTWRMYEPDMNASVYDDMLLAVDLRRALDQQELQLHPQPQFRLSDGALVGMEALLRWRHPTRGMVSPARFIPIAESSGLIVDISHWVLREACRMWAGWRDARLNPPPIAVNLSAHQFQHPDFLREVAQTVAEFGLPPQALEMELTEGLIMGDTEAAIARMHQLVDMGIQLAIDDFGTGYSSLSYLQRFPVGKLKIDRSFVLGLGRGNRQQGAVIASAVIGMAKNLHLKVIAEGVETPEQRDFLREQGCDEVQGYLYAKPMPEAELARLLVERSQRPAGQGGNDREHGQTVCA